MLLTSHVFNYNKRTMLNVLYDTIDTLGLGLVHANSKRGTLIVSISDQLPRTIRIAIESKDNDENTQVQLFYDTDHSTAGAWAKFFFDEVNATIKKSLLAE